MGVLAGECRKVWGNRQIWTGLLLLLVITCFITWVDVRNEWGEEDPDSLTAAYERIEGMAPQDAAVVMGLNQMDDSTRSRVQNGREDWYYGGCLWPSSVVWQVFRLVDIPVYIDETIAEANQKTSISIFAVEGFEKENLIRTKAVYEKVKGISTPMGNHTAAEILLSSDITDMMAVLFGIMILGVLVGQERDSGIFRLYCSCRRGRICLACSKLAVACAGGTLAFLICAAARYGFAVFLAGSGALEVPVQCLSGFEHSGSLLTIGQFLAVWLLTKAVWVCIRLAQMFALTHLIWRLPVAILAEGCLWMTEVFIYHTVSPISRFHILRCLVPESLRLAKESIQTYRNVELFGRTVERLPVTGISALFWLSLLVVLSVFLFCLQADGRLGIVLFAQKRRPYAGKRSKADRKRANGKESVFRYENYKLYISCGGLVIVAMSLVFQWWVRGYNLTPSDSYTEAACRNMLQSLEGEVTEQTLEKVDYLHRYYEADEEKYRFTLQILRNRIDPACEYLVSQTGQGKKVVLFYDAPWKKYLGITSSSWDVQDTFVWLTVLIFLCCGQISLDHRHEETAFLYVTKGGKETMFRAKFRAAALLSACLLLAYTVPPLVEAVWAAGSRTLRYPLCSISSYGAFPDWVTVGGYIVGLTVWRYLVSLVVIKLIYCIAEKIRRYAASVFVCMAVLGSSFLGYFLGSERMADMGILPYLNGNRMAQTSLSRILIFAAAGILAAVGICWYYRKKVVQRVFI